MPDNRRRRQQMRPTGYYVEGSTVRKLEAAPEEHPTRRRRQTAEEWSAGQRRLTAEERRRHAEKSRKKEIARKNQERALRLNLTYTLFLIFSVVVTVAACVFYLSLQNELLRTSQQVSDLKSELSTITNENVAMEERINSAVDLSEVYQRAVGEFGMTAITEGQIHYYSNENQDYVKQYRQIPADD